MSTASSLLTSLNIITSDQFHIAFLEQQRSNRPIEQILVELGFITEATLSSILATRHGLERVDLSHTIPDTQLLRQVPANVARDHQILPLSLQEGKLMVALADGDNIFALDHIRFFFPDITGIASALASAAELKEAIDIYYGAPLSLDQLFEAHEQNVIDDKGKSALSSLPQDSPSMLLANAIIDDAVKKQASDIHFQPEEVFVRLRYRIDGALFPVKIFHKRLWSQLCGRFKIMAKMNIAEHRRPQSGRFHLRLGTHPIDFRVSIYPTVHGESLAIRILDQASGVLRLDNLGFSADVIARLQCLVSKPQGLIIVTGPTGSGKTTTLYALLSSLSGARVNIMTLEDPVEYRLPLLLQTEIHEATDLTFAEGIRSMLRHDPDVLLVGEIRDEDTAQMALRAAMTGHRVFTTLHTNDAYGALGRLNDLGISYSQLVGRLSGIIAQRLVRCLCKECKSACESPKALKGFNREFSTKKVFQAVGCPSCRYTGYRGRRAIVEIIVCDAEIDALLLKKASVKEVLAKARLKGFHSLWEQGLSLVAQGVTSFEEIRSAINAEDK